MIGRQWKKLLNDAWLARGRVLMMIIAISVSIFSIGMILTTYSIISRETKKSYLGSNPAMATIELDRADDALINLALQQPEIKYAEIRSTILARVLINEDDWRPLILFVIRDFNNRHVSTFIPDEGKWPPPPGTMLVERSALEMINDNVYKNMIIKTPNSSRKNIFIAGIVHDTGLAPAWQERAAYGYITPETLALLGEHGGMNELKITLKDHSADMKKIEETSFNLAAKIRNLGYTVKEIQIPPPGKHPHENPTLALITLMLIFCILALFLSAILSASMIGNIMAKESRQIGIMKTIGASTGQIMLLYLTLVFAISLTGFLISVIPAMTAGRKFSETIGHLLNINISSLSIPCWVIVIQFTAGIIIPMITAFFPIFSVSRITVYKAINDYGIRLEKLKKSKAEKPNKFTIGNKKTIYAFRNMFRKKGRLVFTLGLLSIAGGMFLTGLNTAGAWKKNLADGLSARKYDLEIRLSKPASSAGLTNILMNVPDVKKVETWENIPAGLEIRDGIYAVHTYPDGGHGSFSLRGFPEGTELVKFPVIKGRWLKPGENDAVVLNQMAFALFPKVKIGDTVKFAIMGKITEWKVAGIIRETGSPAAAYVNSIAFSIITGFKGITNSIKIKLAGSDPASKGMAIHNIEQTLENNNINISLIVTDAELRTAMGGHIYILVTMLIMMAIIMAIVGVLGLGAAMGINVVERTREFGILQTIGARPSNIMTIVIFEGIFISILSSILAIFISIPFTALVGSVIGSIAFRTPLPVVVSSSACIIWLFIIITASAIASGFPAWKASRLLIRETLSYV